MSDDGATVPTSIEVTRDDNGGYIIAGVITDLDVGDLRWSDPGSDPLGDVHVWTTLQRGRIEILLPGEDRRTEMALTEIHQALGIGESPPTPFDVMVRSATTMDRLYRTHSFTSEIEIRPVNMPTSHCVQCARPLEWFPHIWQDPDTWLYIGEWRDAGSNTRCDGTLIDSGVPFHTQHVTNHDGLILPD